MNAFRSVLGSLATTLPLALHSAACEKPTEPVSARNLVLVMSDQHNARVLGCEGSSVAPTPNLDRLAASGTRFERAFTTTPQCAPARYTIWTGRYAKSHGLRANRVPERAEATFAGVLREAGWRTATVGKHHMTSSPRSHGFDLVIDSEDYNTWREQEGVAQWYAAGEWLSFTEGVFPDPCGMSRLGKLEQQDGWFTTRAIEFLRESPRDTPFCLVLSFFGPHTPITPSIEMRGRVRLQDVDLPPTYAGHGLEDHELLIAARKVYASLTPHQHRRVLAAYTAFVAQMDDNVGRVLDALDELELTEETVVVYTSDHGDMAASHGVWGKNYFLYDEVLRVPLIARVPGALGGAARRELVSLVDLAPTVLELLGLEPLPSMQGASLAPLLLGHPPSGGPQRAVYAEIGLEGSHWGRTTCVRTETHKYVLNDGSGRRHEQLFDLVADPWETENLAASDDVQLADLRRELVAWEARTPDAPRVAATPKLGRKRKR